MQEEKSAVYTVILGVCLLLCLLMLGNMLMGRADTSTAPAAPEEGDAMEFHITEEDIASVMTEALPFVVSIYHNVQDRKGNVILGKTIRKLYGSDTLKASIGALQFEVSPYSFFQVHKEQAEVLYSKLRTALLFLPERCKLYGAWSVAVSNGKLSLACRTIKLEGFTLPEQTAQALSDAFAAQWNTRMEQRDFTPQTIQWQDGEAVLLG